ncbi:MAG: hypothetical protein A3F13_05295 [Gammaproteobacteria bacterium RIFCSPHIGHO2_12_FULL_40_19]|nr:MAG: hypothetical protein A3F13_05295 [Gammaproteobacteria bacterium RIFCSPHIGHO2_12_FULL_40_19]
MKRLITKISAFLLIVPMIALGSGQTAPLPKSNKQHTTSTCYAVPVRQTVDVIVVGAGIAGLVAARQLIKANVSVVVLEARDRVGGRVFRKPTIENGWVDLGAQWVGKTQDRILSLTDELGLKRFEWYPESSQDTKEVFYWNGTRMVHTGDLFDPAKAVSVGSSFTQSDIQDLARALKKADSISKTVPSDAPWDAPNAEALDSMTLQTWLEQNTSSPLARQLFTLFHPIDQEDPPGGTSALYAFWIGSTSPKSETPEKWLFYGGAGQVPERMAKEIGNRIVVKARVHSIKQDEEGVTVETPIGSYRGRYVIVAIPPHLAGQIFYDPPLPVARMQLTQRVPFGTAIKFIAVYPEAFWRSERLSGGLGDYPTIAYVADSGPPGGRPGILVAFAKSTAVELSLEEKSPAARRDAVLKDIVTTFGPRAANPTQFFVQDWNADPFTAGAATFFTPPYVLATPYGRALRPPIGRIYWAGTETATKWMGFMDGAVRSGETAAQAVLEKLRINMKTHASTGYTENHTAH